jgi:hypothetical protein
MTNFSSYTWLQGAPMSAHSKKHFVRRLAEGALVLLIAAALTGAWLALFMFVPLDFTPPRVR